MKRKYLTVALLVFTISASTAYAVNNSFVGFKLKDPYPLHQTLQYTHKTNKSNDLSVLADIIKDLDIENNARYMKTGVKYKDGKAYEIPLQEVEDFEINTSHNNTYCNIFVIDVLNIMSNTLKDESYRLVKNPIGANVIRERLEQSSGWTEINRSKAVENVNNGEVVLLSHTDKPHGHVAFLRPDSTEDNIWLWNVGATNSSRLKWAELGSTKYFVKER